MLNSIYQVRGYLDCLKQGFNILTDRPWITTRVMGPWALLVSLLLILYIWKYTIAIVNILINGATEPGNILIVYGLYLLLCIGFQCFIARTFIFFRRTQKQIERQEAEAILNEQKNADASLNAKDTVKLNEQKEETSKEAEETEEEKKTKKALKSSTPITFKEFGTAMLSALPYTIIPYILCAPGFSIIDTVSKLIGKINNIILQFGAIFGIEVILLVVAFFLSPFIYTFFDTMMDGEQPFKKNFAFAFHHKGKLFGLMLLSEFISILLCIIPFIPCWIADTAYLQSIEDCVNLGDPAFIPTSGDISIFFICLISLTVMFIISLVSLTPLLYLYGSIRTYENEKRTTNIEK